MATLYQLLASLQQQVVAATSGLLVFDADLDIRVGNYWPSTHALQQLTKMDPPGVIVSIYDRKSGHDSTRWVPNRVALVATQTQLVSSPSTQILPGGASGTITLSGTVTAGDAVSLVAMDRGQVMVTTPGDGTDELPSRAVVYSLSPLDDTNTAAAELGGLVNADPSLSQWLSASVTGSVLTLTNLQQTAATISSFTGNTGTETFELGRRKRDLQLTVWSPSPEIRDAVSAPLEILIAQLEVFAGNFQSGLVLGDGSFARVTHYNDFLVDDAMLSDLYRRDFILCADYPVTSTDILYSVLAPITDYQLTA